MLGLDYTYTTTAGDNNGNIRTQAISTPTGTITQSYGYDSVNRLTSAQEAVSGATRWTQSYGYDEAGNLRTLTLES